MFTDPRRKNQAIKPAKLRLSETGSPMEYAMSDGDGRFTAAAKIYAV